MQVVLKKMEAQLRRWNVKIEQRAAKSVQKSGHPSFEALLHVDELKVLYAIAQSKLEELKASAEADRERLEAETQSAFHDLAAALKGAMPRP